MHTALVHPNNDIDVLGFCISIWYHQDSQDVLREREKLEWYERRICIGLLSNRFIWSDYMKE